MLAIKSFATAEMTFQVSMSSNITPVDR